MKESIELAIKQSVMIHAAGEGVRGAEAQQNEALKAFLPKLSTSYSYTRLNETPTFTMPGASFVIPAVPPAPPITITVPGTTAEAGTRDNYNWVIEGRQPLFAGGAIVANYQLNKLGAVIARWDEKTVVQDIVQEVRVSYFHILKAGRILDVARQSLEQLKAHRDLAQNFYDVGMIPKNDLLYAEVQLANGEQFLVQAENGVEMANSRFNTVLRRGIDTPVVVADMLSYRPFEKTLEDCLAIALANRSEIKSYALKVEQAKKAVRLARSEYFPSLSMVGNYARFGDDPDVAGSLYQDQESWYIMAVANWNFWEWGKTKNKVDFSRSKANQATDLLTNIRDQVTLEVKNAYLLLREAEKQVAVAKRAIDQAEENFRINEERYREQVATSTDVLDAQTLLTKAKSDYYNALGDYNISEARLERAMGLMPYR
ncbi:MAG: TolC family protein [Deltaproteobacteria bacterium]|nr:TolC family protein [Deltaproteobacteria bacterium]